MCVECVLFYVTSAGLYLASCTSLAVFAYERKVGSLASASDEERRRAWGNTLYLSIFMAVVATLLVFGGRALASP